MTTSAQQDLARRQLRYPPRYRTLLGGDRVRQHYEVLAPELPEKLRELVDNGSVAIGEVGRNVPDARVIPTATNGFVVELTSGMIDFQLAVGESLAPIHHEGAQSGDQHGYDRVIHPLERVLLQWSRYIRWSWLFPWRRRVNLDDRSIPQDVRDWIEMMAKMGEFFLLAHELGHVALNMKFVKRISDKDEVDADRYGLEFLIPALRKRWHERLAYAAPVIPIRTFGSLERLGVRFSDAYPPQSQRVQLLREQILKMCPSKQYYYEASTIMVSWLDMLDDIENHIDPRSPRVLPDGERVAVRLIAELEEVARGSVPLTTFVRNIGLLAAAYPEEAMREGARLLVDCYPRNPPPPAAFLPQDLRAKMAAKVTALLANLPPNLKSLFPPTAA